MEVDVLIVGLGPAGATVLSELVKLSNSEFSILAIDHRPKLGFPVQCGEFMPSPEEMSTLMPEVPNSQEFFTFDKKFISTYTKHISFFSPKKKVIQTPFQGYTLHRGDWNNHLIDNGRKNGAEVWAPACATKMNNGEITINKNESIQIQVKPRIIVGADGASSNIAQWTRLAEKRSDNHYVIVKQHVMSGIESYDSTNIQMFFGSKYSPGAYAWIIPKNDNTANVGTGVRLQMLKGDMNVSKALSNLINVHPIASQILKNAQIDQTIAGVVPVGLPLSQTVDMKTKTMLVGDAACQVVSSVGGGIPPSMIGGSIAAKTIIDYLHGNCSLTQYQTEWHKQMLNVLNEAYKLRKFFDKISTGNDSRIQWYMNRLSSNDINKVVHCKIPKKLSLGGSLIKYLNWFIK